MNVDVHTSPNCKQLALAEPCVGAQAHPGRRHPCRPARPASGMWSARARHCPPRPRQPGRPDPLVQAPGAARRASGTARRSRARPAPRRRPGPAVAPPAAEAAFRSQCGACVTAIPCKAWPRLPDLALSWSYAIARTTWFKWPVRQEQEAELCPPVWAGGVERSAA